MRPSFMKLFLVAMLALSSQIAHATVVQIDCAVSEPPNMFHDIVVTWSSDTKKVNIAYSYPNAREDEWFGPYSGTVEREEDQDTYTFDDGTTLVIHQFHAPPPSGISLGTVTLGRDGREAPVSCNWPYESH